MPHAIRGSRFVRWLLGFAALGLAPALGASAYDQGYGYVFANNSTAASYTPSPFYAYNEAGTPPTVTRTGVGRYDVTFPGLSALSSSRGNVHVTAYGTSNHYCKLRSWSGDTVSVACFTAAGAAADTRYSVLYLVPDEYENHYAFALADRSTTASYTPAAASAYNAGGTGAITAIRSAVGQYAIHFAGFAAIGSGDGHVQVTAHGTGNAYCRVDGWGAGSAQVRCRNAAGTPVDSAYSILYWRPEAGEQGLAFAWAHQPTSASYTPLPSFVHDASAGAITATRTSAGVYQMQWSGFGGAGIHGGNVQVTADSGTTNRCKVASWSSNRASIRCLDAAGNLVDTRYTVLFLKPQKKAWSQEYAFAYADRPTTFLYAPPPAYSYNPMGEIEITRPSIGDYNVHFEGFAALPGLGNAHVTAVDTAGRYCKVSSWTTDDVRVRCFTITGALSDARFNVLFLKSSSEPTAVAYAFAHEPPVNPYEPLPDYAYNPSGGMITVTRFAEVWRTRWFGFDAFGTPRGFGLVTAVGLDDKRCAAEDWAPDGVTSYCAFDEDGGAHPEQTPQSVLYLRPDANDDGLAFGRAPDVAISYTVPAPNRFNAGDGEVTSEYLGSEFGRYRMTFEGMARRGIGGGHVQVMAIDPDFENHCAIEDWDVESVDVRCFHLDGTVARGSSTEYGAIFIKPIALP